MHYFSRPRILFFILFYFFYYRKSKKDESARQPPPFCRMARTVIVLPSAAVAQGCCLFVLPREAIGTFPVVRAQRYWAFVSKLLWILLPLLLVVVVVALDAQRYAWHHRHPRGIDVRDGAHKVMAILRAMWARTLEGKCMLRRMHSQKVLSKAIAHH